ncbi:MAM domain-containing glycosylphosphatidylinositol anchor protein 1, partial [Takifugu flavidus]
GVAKPALCFFSPTAPANAQIVHSGAACNVNDDNISERIYTIKEGYTLVLQCIVKGHPRPQYQPQLVLDQQVEQHTCIEAAKTVVVVVEVVRAGVR